MVKKMYFDSEHNVLKIDGKTYIGKQQMYKSDGHSKDIELVEIDSNHEARLLKIAKTICTRGKVNAPEIVAAALRYADLKSIEKLEKSLKAKDKVVKKKGCFAIAIGKGEIQIVG